MIWGMNKADQQAPGADNAAANLIDEAATRVGDKDWQEVRDHWADECSDVLVGSPSLRDEKCCDDAPSDECTDVGHDHRRQECAQFLNGDADAALLFGRSCSSQNSALSAGKWMTQKQCEVQVTF